MNNRTCSIDGCSTKHYGRGYCRKHYRRWKRHGDPHKNLALRNADENFSSRTEWQGECLIWTGSLNADGYGRFYANSKTMLAHRFSWERSNGKVPEGLWIDHICYTPACVNVEHMRLVTIQQNNYNRSGPFKANRSSGLRNVHRSRDKWKVQVKHLGENHYMGVYETKEEAAKVAEQARRDLFGEYAGRG